MSILVEENFLNTLEAREIELLVTGGDIDYKFKKDFIYQVDKSRLTKFMSNDVMIINPTTNSFIHMLYFNGSGASKHYAKFEKFKTLIEKKFKITVKSIKHMRINFVTPLGYSTRSYTCPHTDSHNDSDKTLIYYITDNDGDTVFFKERWQDNDQYTKRTLDQRITPKKGKAILFDSNQYHAACFPSKDIKSIVNLCFSTDK